MANKRIEKLKETNSSVIKKMRKNLLSCSFCPPHAGENLKRSPPRYGVTKPKYKDKLTKLIQQCMSIDHSWESVVHEYKKVYESLQ